MKHFTVLVDLALILAVSKSADCLWRGLRRLNLNIPRLSPVDVRNPYFIVSPNLLREGVEETVVVVLHGVSQPVPVSVEIKSDDKSKTFLQKLYQPCKPDNPTVFKVVVKDTDLGDARGISHVRLVVKSTDPKLLFSEEARVMVTRRVGHVFLQLDKPIYHPNKKMQIRAFNVDQHLKPSKRTVRLEIKDPDGNVLSREDNAPEKVYPGIIHFTPFHFPQIPALGTWTATAYYGSKWLYKEEVKFEVKDYTLPKFDVSVSYDNIISPSSTKATGKIGAKYTYGKPVVGRVEIIYSVVDPEDTTKLYTETKQLDIQGKTDFELDLYLVKQANMWFPTATEKKATLMVEAKVKEEATGTELEDFTLIPFLESSFDISFERTLKYFKPGLPFMINVDITSLVPLPQGTQKVPLFLQVHYLDIHGSRILMDRVGGTVSTTDTGSITVMIDNAPRDSLELDIFVRTKYQGGNIQNGDKTFKVTRQYAGGSEDFISLRIMKQDIKIDDTVEVELFSSSQRQTPLNYFVLANGDIIQAHTIAQQGGAYKNLRIQVSQEMAPESTLVVYTYMLKNGKYNVVADSAKIKTTKECHKKVTLATVDGRHEYKPGEKMDLAITASANSQVALLAVDQSVYLLQKSGVLYKDKMFEFMEKRELSCSEGGGRNSGEVFADAGVSIMSNLDVSSSTRENEFCQEKDEDDFTASQSTSSCCQRGQRFQGNCRKETFSHLSQRINSVQCSITFYRCCVTPPTPPPFRPYFRSRGGWGVKSRQGLPGMVFSKASSIDNFFPGFRLESAVIPRPSEAHPKFTKIQTNKERLQRRHQLDESWLWEIADINSNGKAIKTLSLKDTITTWVFQGVGMSLSHGMCVASPLNITTMKNFFIHMELPKTAVKGEQMEVKATIFNYGNIQQRVLAYLEGMSGICSGAKPGDRSGKRDFQINPNDAFSLSWPIIPMITGELAVRVQAYVKSDGDYLEKKLKVIPPGKEVEESKTVTLDPLGEGDGHVDTVQNISDRIRNIPNKVEGKQTVTINMEIPSNYVSKSGKAVLSFWGDMLGPVVEGVLGGMEAMIRMPRGCGEQTMIYTGPTVYTTRYLKNTGQMTNSIETKAYGFIQQGVQRMMTFRKADTGAFSVWPHYPASSWLTSFVVKVFAQAREFNTNPDLQNIICKAASWVSGFLNSDGSFYDPYRTIHQGDLVGGINDKVTLTAFILIALKEADCSTSSTQNAVHKASQYLANNLRSMQRSYDLAITTYALALVNHPLKLEANQKLRQMSTFDEGTNQRYWEYSGLSLRSGTRASSLEIETAAYALLAQLELGEIMYSHPIVNWLLDQRQSNGVFRSTQDTVVGLQSLTEYKLKTRRSDLHMQIEVTSDLDSVSHQLFLTSKDGLLHKKIQLSQYMGQHIKVQATGKGVAFMDFKMVYNVHVHSDDQETPSNCQFDLTVTSEDCAGDATGDCQLLTIKTRYKEKQRTDMSIIEVGLFTGFEANKEDLGQIVNGVGNSIPMYELSGRLVQFYVDNIPHDKDVIVSFRIHKKFSVGNVQAVPVKVYKYYDPDVSCTKFYHPAKGSPILAMDCSGDNCKCLAGGCGKCYGFGEEYKEKPWSLGEMKRKVCQGDVLDYAINATVVEKEVVKEVEVITALIDFVGKRGNDDTMQPQMEVVFKRRMECNCPELEVGTTYLFMGRDGIKEENGDILKYVYFLDDETYVVEYFGGRKADTTEIRKAGNFQDRFMKFISQRGCST